VGCLQSGEVGLTALVHVGGRGIQMIDFVVKNSPGQAAARGARSRLRARSWPILQTAVAAVAAWYLASLLVAEDQPVFASIAAVVSLGATYGQRPERVIELIGGVVLGIGVADMLVRVIGSGPAQIGVMVVLAMAVAVVLGGGPVLVTEAAVSAILLVVLEPSTAGLAPSRLIEALVGGGVALAVSAIAFPLDPVLLVGRSAQAVFGELGRTLEEVGDALAEGDGARSEAALRAARELDSGVRALDEALVVGAETARFSPGRRSARSELDRYARAARHMDFAVRNTRVLARHVLRFVRTGRPAPPELPQAIRDLSLAVWALAAELDSPTPDGTEVRLHASRASARAIESFGSDPDLGLAEIVAQVRSTAIDLVRAEDAGASTGEPPEEIPTEELLVDVPRGWAPAGERA
jgi:uncharacterized membrane protein YgaE (UPF0421/DUF939 family)